MDRKLNLIYPKSTCYRQGKDWVRFQTGFSNTGGEKMGKIRGEIGGEITGTVGDVTISTWSSCRAYLYLRGETMVKKLCCLILFLMFTGFFTTFSDDMDSYVQKTEQGEIDWGEGFIKVKGNGVAPEGMPKAQAKLMGKRAAVVDAYRNFAEIVNGVQVDSETTVENFITKSDIIKTKVSGFIQGARIYDEKQLEDGSYEIELIAHLFGDGSLGIIFFEEEIEEETQETEQKEEKSSKASKKVSQAPEEKFTGLVVDARGTDVKPCLLPRVDDITPQLVYDASYVDEDVLKKEGIVTYLKAENEEEQGKINEIMLALSKGTFSDIPLFQLQENSYQIAGLLDWGKKLVKFAKKVGTNPLLVKALTGQDIDLKTIFKEKDYSTLYNLLIAKEDREKIEKVIKVNDFLKEGKVVVILGDKEVKLGKAN